MLTAYMKQIAKFLAILHNNHQNGNMRMKILHTAAKFTSNISDLKIIYNQYIRSVLEYGSDVWHSSLTQQNKDDFERLQRCSVKIILKNNYESWQVCLKHVLYKLSEINISNI